MGMPKLDIIYIVPDISKNGTLMSQNRSVSSVIRYLIDMDSAVQDTLWRDYANLSALARILKPKVDGLLGRNVSTDTIVTTLRRLRGMYSKIQPSVADVLARSTVNVLTDVARISLKRTRANVKTVRYIVSRYQSGFIQVLEGISTLTLIYDSRLQDRIVSRFTQDSILYDDTDMAALIIKSPIEISRTPGCIASILQQLSRRGINVDEVLSSLTDTVIIIRLKDVGAAFEAITELINFSRQMLQKGLAND